MRLKRFLTMFPMSLIFPEAHSVRIFGLMKLLPLAPPTCKRFLAVLAALGQTRAAEAASQEAEQEGEDREQSDERGHDVRQKSQSTSQQTAEQHRPQSGASGPQ